MTNFSLIRLKQCCGVIGGVLLASAIPACNAVSPSQSSSTKPSPVASSSLSPSPILSASSTPPPNDAERLEQEAAQVIQNYYSAIDRHDYTQAYSAWEGEGTASQQSFEQFKQGFATTASTAVEVGQPNRSEGAAGSSYIEIPVTVTAAVTTDGTSQRFRGSYVLRRVNDVPGSTPEQRKWHLYSANLTQVH
ncbi:MAG TPA: nuclear transport factor 2 family protein [Allocoleopsis sp.]